MPESTPPFELILHGYLNIVSSCGVDC